MATRIRDTHTPILNKVGDYRWTPTATTRHGYNLISLITTDQYISLSCDGDDYVGSSDAIKMDRYSGVFPDEEVCLHLDDDDTYPLDFRPIVLGTTSNNELYIRGYNATRVGVLSQDPATSLWEGTSEDSDGNYRLTADGEGFRIQGRDGWSISKRVTYSMIEGPKVLKSYIDREAKRLLDGLR